MGYIDDIAVLCMIIFVIRVIRMCVHYILMPKHFAPKCYAQYMF
jgi:hypothetical protein